MVFVMIQPLGTPKIYFMYTKDGLWVIDGGLQGVDTPKISGVQRGSPLSQVVNLWQFGVQDQCTPIIWGELAVHTTNLSPFGVRYSAHQNYWGMLWCTPSFLVYILVYTNNFGVHDQSTPFWCT
jgi:hypothetical protein